MAVPSASADETRCPSMAVITDRGVMPADAAGDPGRTLSTNAPEVAFNPSRGAVSDSRSSVATPRNPGGPMTMLPVSFPDRIVRGDGEPDARGGLAEVASGRGGDHAHHPGRGVHERPARVAGLDRRVH